MIVLDKGEGRNICINFFNGRFHNNEILAIVHTEGLFEMLAFLTEEWLFDLFVLLDSFQSFDFLLYLFYVFEFN